MQNPPTEEPRGQTETAAQATPGTPTPAREGPAVTVNSAGVREETPVKLPEFAPLAESRSERPAMGVDRFYDVHVPVWAELGRIEMPLGELLKLDEGAVLRLDRPVSEPVDLVSQGVKLARGEVVVIEDCFAIRIKEIESAK